MNKELKIIIEKLEEFAKKDNIKIKDKESFFEAITLLYNLEVEEKAVTERNVFRNLLITDLKKGKSKDEVKYVFVTANGEVGPYKATLPKRQNNGSLS